MKRLIAALLCTGLVFVIAGCGNATSSGKALNNQTAGVNDVLEKGMAEADKKTAGEVNDPAQNVSPEDQPDAKEKPGFRDPSASDEKAPSTPSGGIDVDLTILSSTMVYSEVYNMMLAPEQYIGKKIKMDGLFSYFRNEETGNEYFACIVQDATACCAQGIEFELSGEHKYPDDYPALDSEICVVGDFDTYNEGNYTYYTLRNASFV